MRIAQLIDSLNWGGAQKLLVTFTAAARAHNLRPTIIALRRDRHTPIPDELQALGARVETFPARRLLDPVRFVRLVNFLRRERFDVLHTHLAYANLLGVLAGQFAGVPVVSTLHNVQVEQRRTHPLRDQLETWALCYGARRVFAVGYVVAETNRARLGGKKMDVVLNAVNLAPSLAAAERAAIRAELAGDPARPLLVAVGRLSHQKGYGDLLTAFATLRQTHPHAALIIAGGGGRHAELSAQIASLHLEHHAWLLGARNDVPRLLAASDIFVSASHWEGLPVAVLEAMAAGLPIVATSVGDVPRVVSAEAGLIVPPHQPDLLAGALRTLLDNPVQRQRLGEAARAYVTRNHSPAAWVEQLLALYAEAERKNQTYPMTSVRDRDVLS